MIRYKSNIQLKIEEFTTPLETKLDPNNRWVKLSKEIPWDCMASVYYRKLSQNKGIFLGYSAFVCSTKTNV